MQVPEDIGKKMEYNVRNDEKWKKTIKRYHKRFIKEGSQRILLKVIFLHLLFHSFVYIDVYHVPVIFPGIGDKTVNKHETLLLSSY